MKKFKKVDSIEIPEIEKALEATPGASKRFISKSLDIAHQISLLLREREMLQKTLAAKLQKEEPEISKWLSGTHNFTIRTITALEEALNEEILIPPFKLRLNWLVGKAPIAATSKKSTNEDLRGEERYKIKMEKSPKYQLKVA